MLTLAAEEFDGILGANPFAEGEVDPAKLHLYLCAEHPTDPDLDRLDALRRESERYRLTDRTLYLHAPEGIGRSKLAAAVERALGVVTTARNLRTARAIAELAGTS